MIFVALLAHCLVLSAFSHQAIAFQATEIATDFEASAYLLPGETLASLCINSGDSGKSMEDQPCAFCTLAHGVNCSKPPVDIFHAQYSAPLFAIVATKSNSALVFRPWAPSHGPPNHS